MCTKFCLEFVKDNLPASAIMSKDVLEVGSRDVNGSCKKLIHINQPRSYFGIDIRDGKNVDRILSVFEIESEFGSESFDVIINTEMLEHVYDWRSAVNQMKSVLKIGGYLALTTRSPGYPYHRDPDDFWRFTSVDMESIFGDFDMQILAKDPQYGIGVICRKISNSRKNLSNISVMKIRKKKSDCILKMV